MGTDTAEKVLEAATRAFASVGFEGASVRNICKAAGVNAQAIHYHFGSKADLYRAVIERFVEAQDAIVSRLVTAPAASVEDLRTRLLFFMDTVMEFWLRSPGLEVAYNETKRQGPHTELAFQSLGGLDRALGELLASSQEAGLLRSDVDLELVASTLTERAGAQAVDAELMELFLGYSLRDAEARRDWVGKFIDMMLFGIAAERPVNLPKPDS
jgi:AcrR family transcriptional regulator